MADKKQSVSDIAEVPSVQEYLHILEISNQKSVNDFKRGVADGLFVGNRNENDRNGFYKQGYDFGIAMYSRLLDEGKIDG